MSGGPGKLAAAAAALRASMATSSDPGAGSGAVQGANEQDGPVAADGGGTAAGDDAGDGLGPLRTGDIVAASPACGINIPKTHAGTVLAVTDQGAAVSWTRMHPGKGSLAPIWIPSDGGGHVDVVKRYAGG